MLVNMLIVLHSFVAKSHCEPFVKGQLVDSASLSLPVRESVERNVSDVVRFW